MANHHKGDHVKITHHTPHVPAGAHGHIASTHHGKIHTINVRGGIVYMPDSKVTDPDHDGDNDAPGGNDPDNDPVATASLEELVDILSSIRRGRSFHTK